MNRTEKAIYNKYGIAVDGNKLVTPIDGIAIAPMLKDNNTKTNGTKKERENDSNTTRVWTFGILPTCETFKTKYGEICGTCPCTCEKGYCTRGFYNMPSNINGLAIRTLIIRNHLEWFINAINAQLETINNGDFIRIHDVGDFDSIEYLNAWIEIIKANPNKSFWTYTKHEEYEKAFNGLPNANIVQSCLPSCGYNFGHIDYLLNAYRYLVAIGETPFICRCGIDKKQHCYNCNKCITNKYVLFVEHSTEYNAESDSHYELMKSVIEMQDTATVEEIAEYIAEQLNK